MGKSPSGVPFVVAKVYQRPGGIAIGPGFRYHRVVIQTANSGDVSNATTVAAAAPNISDCTDSMVSRPVWMGETS